MAKKIKIKTVKKGKGRKAKKGVKYTCKECGIVLSVDDPCGCDPCDLICCNQDMQLISC